MSLKYSSTTADYLQWSEAMNLIRKLARDSNYKMSLLIALGCFTGLRISDILALKSLPLQRLKQGSKGQLGLTCSYSNISEIVMSI